MSIEGYKITIHLELKIRCHNFMVEWLGKEEDWSELAILVSTVRTTGVLSSTKSLFSSTQSVSSSVRRGRQWVRTEGRKKLCSLVCH